MTADANVNEISFAGVSEPDLESRSCEKLLHLKLGQIFGEY